MSRPQCKPILEAGFSFNNWTILRYDRTKLKYECRCACGTVAFKKGYLVSKGYSKSCGCLFKMANVERSSKPGYYPMFHSIYHNYRKQASERNYVFELTLDQFIDLAEQNCHYCNTPPSNTWKGGLRKFKDISGFKYNGIDRKDNEQGYIIENSVPCCQKCNFAKKNFHYNEWVEWIKQVYTNLLNTGRFNDYPQEGVERKSMALEIGSIRKDGDIV